MSTNEIRGLIASYLANEIPIGDVEDLIAQRTWNIHRTGDEQAKNLAYSIEASIAEFSGGHIDESSLRKKLLPLVTAYTPELTVEWASIVHTQESSNLTTLAKFQFAVSGPLGESLARELSSIP
jgi:hypothetical protein